MDNLERFLSDLPPGNFTCGARYICFLPKGTNRYRHLAEAPGDLYDTPEWSDFAEAVCEIMNAKHAALAR